MTTKSSDPLDRFHREYVEYHGISKPRARAQRKMLDAFAGFAGCELLECGGDDLAAFLGKMVKDGLHVNTVRKNANMIRPFYTWAYGAGLVDAEQRLSIGSVKNPQGASAQNLPRPYGPKDLELWRKELDDRYPLLTDARLNRWRTGRASYRRIADHAIRLQVEAVVALALCCGLRRTEIGNASIDDIHHDNAYVVVRQRGKRANGKDHFREVPHTKHSREAVERWLDFREELSPTHEHPWLSLAPNQGEGGWLRPIPRRRYEKLLTNVGNWQLHRFRHTCATTWLRAGMSLELVSRLLGHSNVTQTLCYAEIVRDDIHRAVEKYEDAFEEQINGNRKE